MHDRIKKLLPWAMARKGVSSYKQGWRSQVRGLWSGALSVDSFTDGMDGLIRREFTIAWRDGAAECGITPEELSSAELNALNVAIFSEINHVFAFAAAIVDGNKESGGPLQPLLDRFPMWLNGLTATKSQGQIMACSDQKMIWQFTPGKEHCIDCDRLNGRVHRASVWAAVGITSAPHPGTACGGFRCGCTLTATEQRANGGRPPRLRGR